MGTTRQESEPVKSDTVRRLPKSIVYPTGDLPDGWREEAACLGQDPRVWVTSRPKASAPRRLRLVCADCPVAIPCLVEGLSECRASARTSDTIGTRAGTSAWVRHKLYRAWIAGDVATFRAELIAADWHEGRADEMVAQLPGKACTKCLVVKPQSGFYVNRRKADGKASWCKECTKESVRVSRGGRQ